MDSTYAPQSPDLSSFLSSPSKSQQPYQPQPSTLSTSYAPRSPEIPSFNHPAPTAPAAPQHLYSGYHSNPQPPFGGGAYGGNPIPTSNPNIGFDTYGNSSYGPPIPELPPQHSFAHSQPTNPAPYFPQPHSQPYFKPEPHSFHPTDNSFIPSYSSPDMASRAPRGNKSGSSLMHTQNPTYKDPNPTNIEIRTKFPVARIKRIMQADEEVGKVAQVTPVVVSKALELFMIALVTGAAEKAKEKGGKRVTAQHLKAVVMESPDQFDFLADIVGRVAEVTEGAGGEGRKKKEVKKEEGSDSSEEEKKVKKARGRRKKADE